MDSTTAVMHAVEPNLARGYLPLSSFAIKLLISDQGDRRLFVRDDGPNDAEAHTETALCKLFSHPRHAFPGNTGRFSGPVGGDALGSLAKHL
jgi:hypothetical protein